MYQQEHETLLEMTRKGKIKVRQIKRAMILLKANEGLSDPQIMSALNVSRPCVGRVRRRFVLGGMEKALNEDPRPEQRRKLDSRVEATLIATACSRVPEGHEHRTLRLLAGKMVELAVVDTISYETVRRTLKKRNKALAERNVVHSGGRCGICGLHGERSRSIRASL
ncbi:MAG: helix-turn-helix domain-containing protein [Anaerolineaceae bacterium]